MDLSNKTAPGVSEGILHAEQESSDQVFEKKGVETSKINVFSHFWKIVDINTYVPEPSLIFAH